MAARNALQTRLSPSQIVRGKIQLTSGAYHAALARLWQQPDRDRAVISFLIFLHQIMRASVPLMKLARDCASKRAADPVCARLVTYFDEHIPEERDHDLWVLEDLEAAGVARAEVLDRVPPPQIASLVGSQYYWIHHHHPVALLGYIAILEGSPPSQSGIDRIRDGSKLPEAAFRTYRKHGQIDGGHTRALDDTLDALPLTQSQEGLIGLSAMHSAHLLAEGLDDLMELRA